MNWRTGRGFAADATTSRALDKLVWQKGQSVSFGRPYGVTRRGGLQGPHPGEEYTVTGTLMDKETGEPVQLGGKDVTATTSFVPDKSSGSVSLSFTFDGSALKGHDIVAFKTVSKEGAEVAVHADIDDPGQTVSLADKPATPTSPAPKGGLPKTGDSVPWIPLACLVAAAACGIAILALMRRKGHWDAEDDDGAE